MDLRLSTSEPLRQSTYGSYSVAAVDGTLCSGVCDVAEVAKTGVDDASRVVDAGSGAACLPYGFSGVSTIVGVVAAVEGVGGVLGDGDSPTSEELSAGGVDSDCAGGFAAVGDVDGSVEGVASLADSDDEDAAPVASALLTVTLGPDVEPVAGALAASPLLVASEPDGLAEAVGELPVDVLALPPDPESGVSAAATAGAAAEITAADIPTDNARRRPAVIFFIARFVTETPRVSTISSNLTGSIICEASEKRCRATIHTNE